MSSQLNDTRYDQIHLGLVTLGPTVSTMFACWLMMSVILLGWSNDREI